jgi:hypothetical protein
VGAGVAGVGENSSVATTQEAERLLRLMGEAEEVCTRLGRDLDDKAQRLERLLARAEGMLGEREQPTVTMRPVSGHAVSTSAERSSSEGLYTPPTSGGGNGPGYQNRPEIVTRPVGVPAAQQGAYATPYPQQRVGGGGVPQHAQPSPAQAMFGPQSHAATAQPHGGAAGNDPEALAQQIYRLSDAGLTPSEIAQRLGQHTGKVELIIALRNS